MLMHADQSSLGSADPLIMSNGRDLLDMICRGYESPDGEGDKEDELFDYSETATLLARQTMSRLLYWGISI
jgi:hypothetical protein